MCIYARVKEEKNINILSSGGSAGEALSRWLGRGRKEGGGQWKAPTPKLKFEGAAEVLSKTLEGFGESYRHDPANFDV